MKNNRTPSLGGMDFTEPYKGEAWRQGEPWEKGYQAAKKEIQGNVQTVLTILEGYKCAEHRKLVNYIKKYLLT